MGKYNARPNPNKKRKANPNLSNLTFNITDDILDGLTYGESRGWWATRSEGARIVMHRGLNIVFQEKIKMNDEIDKVIETDLDPKKKYVNIPGKGYIEVIGRSIMKRKSTDKQFKNNEEDTNLAKENLRALYPDVPDYKFIGED